MKTVQTQICRYVPLRGDMMESWNMANSITDGLGAGSWILEQLSLQIADVEMAAARRAWHEAGAAWPGEERRLWWKWLTEAAQSIGLQSRTIDCTADEALQMIRNGAQVITWREPTEDEDGSDGVWLGIRDCHRHKTQIMQANPLGSTAAISLRQLRRKLSQFEQDGRIRCVIIRHDTDSGIDSDHGVHMHPFSRLQALLRPEWSDIWIVLVFSFVVGILLLAIPLAIESLVNTVAFGRLMQPVVVLAMMLLTFLGFSAALRALQTYVVEIVQRRLFARIAGDLAFRLPRVQAEALDGIYLPELTNRFFDIVTVQKVAASLLLDGVGLVLSALIGMAVLAFYHPWLLGFDLVMMAVIAFIIFVLGRGAIETAIKESKNKYYMASWLEDIARCPATFRSSGGPDLALERADRLVHQYMETRGKHFVILMRQIVFALGLQAVASTVLLGLGGWLVISGQLTLGQLVAAELIVTVIVGAFAKLGKHMESFYDLLASVDKLGHLFDLPIERCDGLLQMSASGPAAVWTEGLSYKKENRKSLPGSVSFNLESGGSLAVLGGSGCGKSTFMDLMYGLRKPSSGHLTIDGYNPLDLRSDVLREHIALVRRGEVFDGTLEENVHMHRSDVSSAAVRHALEQVGLYDQVLRLPKGFEARLNGNGEPLSGTQQDLLCIARAIAGSPRLLLVDGVLDGLCDDELEDALVSLLAEDRPWSLILATGRRSIAERCDSMIRLSRPNPRLRFSAALPSEKN